MSKLDRLKEELAWLKVLFTVFALVDVSLIAWLAQHYSTAGSILIGMDLIGAVCMTLAIIWINKAALTRFKALEDE